MDPKLDTTTTVMLVLVILIFATLLIALLVSKLSSFKHDLDIYNMEIARTTGAERQYWKRERRRLWLSLIPFVRR